MSTSTHDDRMRVLSVLSSSNQMYSGIGRNVFELADRMRGRVAMEFAVDDLEPRNLDLVRRFAAERGMPVHVGRGVAVADALDHRNLDLPGLVAEARWDLVECLCWANAATNDDLLDALGDRVPLAYTPHHQPSWTVPMDATQQARTEAVHRRTTRRADLVLCDSPWERDQLQPWSPGMGNCRVLRLGVDFARYRPGPVDRPPRVLFIGDLAEPRKRFDRVVAVFEVLLARWPELRLGVVGNRSDRAHDLIPGAIRGHVDLHGYLDESALIDLLASSRALFLLSEFEAFGIPILEALAVGTPVFLTEMAPTRSLFGEFRGAHFCPADDLGLTSEIVVHTLESGRMAVLDVLNKRKALAGAFDWDDLAARKWLLLASAWAGRRGFRASA